MPIYEFRCLACATSFEELLPLRARERAPCPRCRRSSRRIAAAFAVQGSAKSVADAPGRRGRVRPRIELPEGVAKPPVTLGAPPPLPERYVRQIRHHGHC
jgi:putative FmdB family regulatory protein